MRIVSVSLFVSLAAALLCSLSACGQDPGHLTAANASQAAKIYTTYCAACHKPDGSGGGDNNIPPLNGSPWLSGPDGKIVRIVLHGVRGPVKVGDKTYNLEMLAFGPVLNDQQIALVLNHVRKEFSTLSSAELTRRMISDKLVARIRAENSGRTEYWTAQELEAIME
jgi:mono/diheme cytochrome c family protein